MNEHIAKGYKAGYKAGMAAKGFNTLAGVAYAANKWGDALGRIAVDTKNATNRGGKKKVLANAKKFMNIFLRTYAYFDRAVNKLDGKMRTDRVMGVDKADQDEMGEAIDVFYQAFEELESAERIIKRYLMNPDTKQLEMISYHMSSVLRDVTAAWLKFQHVYEVFKELTE